MKFLKNNKGVTGIDIVMSILIIIISVTLITIMYSKYSEKSKEIKRNASATNIAMKVIEEIDKTKFDDITDKLIEENFKIDTENGYTVRVKKVEELENIFIKFKVETEYKIGNKSETVELYTTKVKYNGQANNPNMDSIEIKNPSKEITITVSDSTGITESGEYTRYIVKYSNPKKGYIKAKTSDDDWYSISGKKFAVIAYAKEKPIPFNTNGVIDFSKCPEIYVWVPRFGIDSEGNYRFCVENLDKVTNKKVNNPIKFVTSSEIDIFDSAYSVSKYEVDIGEKITVNSSFAENETGKWVKVNKDLNPIDEDGIEITNEENILNIMKTEEFTWE